MSSNAPLLTAKDLQNPQALDRSWIEHLSAHFSQVDTNDFDIARKLIRYVVDGTDSEVILELGGSPSIGTALRIHLSFLGNNDRAYKLTQKRNKERELFLWPRSKVAAEVWKRLGEALEALFLAGKIQATVLPTWPGWLKTLLGTVMAARETASHYGYWTIDRWEPVLDLAGLPKDTAARMLLDATQRDVLNQLRGTFASFIAYLPESPLEKTDGIKEHLARNSETVREMLQVGDASQRTYAIRTLIQLDYDFRPVKEALVDIACAGAKTARETALMALAKIAADARPLLVAKLQNGDPAQRLEAASALWRLLGADARSTLEKHAETEESERVKQTIAKLIAAPTEEAAVVASLELPPVTVPLQAPLGEKARKELRDFIVKTQEQHMEAYRRQLEEYNKPDRPQYAWKPTKPNEVGDKEIDAFLDFVENGGAVRMIHGMHHNKPFDDWFAPPDVQLIHVVRLSLALQFLTFNPHYGMNWHYQADLESYRSRCSPRFGLREVAACVAALAGATPGQVERAYLTNNNKYWTFCNWEPEAIWPAFAENLDLLREALGPSPNRGTDYRYRDYTFGTRRDNAFKVLAMFSQLPSEFIPLLWDLALGESKADRLPAQDALGTVTGKTAKVLVALEDGKQSVRSAAADWLGRLSDPVAVEPLKEAFRKEKQEVVKGTIMAALDALGANVEEFLDRKKLAKDAEKGLAKKKPKGMEWFPLDSLPALHWQDNGKRVDPAIVQWWAVQGVAQKTPVAGPLLRRYLQMCRPGEASELARFTLKAWIGADTDPISHEEAAERANQQANQQWQWANHPQMKAHYDQLYQGKKENLYQELYNRIRNECKGSAIGEKGVLSLVSAAGDAECVKLAEQYIRKWFGQRLAQCKALVEVLAWLDHPSAVQVLLSIGNRFRTKSIRDAAAEHVKALAERQGWTLDELADRTLPDAGFERETDDAGRPIGEEAKLVLDYGPRTFTVKLSDDLEPVITTEDGKTIKSPPAPGKNDDEEKAKAAKKRFSDAKKTVKQVVKTQTERFYEAMCTQRRWRFDDWQRYLAHHPIAGKLCCQVAWAVFDEVPDAPAAGALRGCFRPMEDGSLTNEKDEAVTLPTNAILRVAHTCNVTPELEAAWQQHLKDYDIDPLFAQFGRPVFALPEKQRKDTDIKDFEGHCLSNFKLRGKATKLGYIRGPAEDGGWFHLYRKPFITLEIEAIIGFTGSPLPEEDRTVALLSLAFQRLKQDGNQMGYWDNAALALEKVPAVLLSECYNDIKQFAAEGSGFDAEWNKKAYY